MLWSAGGVQNWELTIVTEVASHVLKFGNKACTRATRVLLSCMYLCTLPPLIKQHVVCDTFTSKLYL